MLRIFCVNQSTGPFILHFFFSLLILCFKKLSFKNTQNNNPNNKQSLPRAELLHIMSLLCTIHVPYCTIVGVLYNTEKVACWIYYNVCLYFLMQFSMFCCIFSRQKLPNLLWNYQIPSSLNFIFLLSKLPFSNKSFYDLLTIYLSFLNLTI